MISANLTIPLLASFLSVALALPGRADQAFRHPSSPRLQTPIFPAPSDTNGTRLSVTAIVKTG